MRSATQRIINRPITVVIMFILLMAMAGFLLPNLVIDLYPEMEPPFILVNTIYRGAGPEEVEKNVTKILEGQLSSVSDVKQITSTSSEGASIIMIEFDYNKDLIDAVNDIRDKLELAEGNLPDDVSKPTIFKLDRNSQAIVNLVMRGNKSPEELRELAVDIVESRLERISGVSTTTITGGRDKLIRVEVSQNRLEAYGLTLTAIASSLASQNIQVNGGDISQGDYDYYVRTPEEFTSIEEIKNTIVASSTGINYSGNLTSNKVVRLRDVADVFEGFDKLESIVTINGNNGVYIGVTKESGTNSTEVADNIKGALAEINSSLPAGVSVEVLYDSTIMIRGVINQVLSSLWQGLLLAMLIIFLFLRNLRSTIIIGLAIPISMLTAVLFMYFFNISLNMMSLTGLILGLGMVVDGSIVILENIYKYRERDTAMKTSAVLGSHEMSMSIIISNLTTLCVFIPILVFKSDLGMIGELFEDLIITIMIALLSSLVVALTLVPVLSSHYIGTYSRLQKPLKVPVLIKIDNAFERFFTNLNKLYEKLIRAALNNKGLVVALTALLFIFSILNFGALGISLMPSMAENSITVELNMEPGTSLERTRVLVDQFKDIVKEEIKGIDYLVVTAGSVGNFESASSYKGTIEIYMDSDNTDADNDMTAKNKLRPYFDNFPQAEFVFAGRRFGMGNSDPVDIIIKSDDLEKATVTANNIKEVLLEYVPSVAEPKSDMEASLPEFQVVIDRDRAYAFGLNVQTIAGEIEASLGGKTATIFRNGGDEYDVMVILKEEDRSSLPDLDKISVISSRGNRIALSNVASIVADTGPQSINREDEMRTIHVTGDIAGGYSSTEVKTLIKDAINEYLVIDEDVRIEYGGDFADIETIGSSIIIILIMAIMLVFGIMASQFESLKDPFIIIFTIPLMLIGVIWFYYFTGQPFSMFSAIGIVVLAGLVVNNGIVLVDYTNLLRARGMNVREAAIKAGGSRLRPILMTSFTTILGMAPLAFASGEDGSMVQPIAQTIIGGLIASTVMTLLFVPVLYVLLNKEKTVTTAEEEIKEITV